jgi:HEPN domain-containing protein
LLTALASNSAGEENLSAPADLRSLAAVRVREAKALLDSAEWSGAYYLAGYAVECALKACISRAFGRYRIPDPQIMKEIYTHRLETLVKIANLQSQLEFEKSNDQIFALNWTVAKDWSESSRYATWTEAEARDLNKAITQRNHGVLRWAKQHW